MDATTAEPLPDIGKIDRQDLALYQHHRSHHTDLAAASIGCIVIVDVPIVEPDPESQRDWIDTVMEALRVESPPGLVAAHFHVSTDGSRVVNYAEWTSGRAHRDSLQGGTDGSIDRTGRDEWRRVRAHPALAPGSRVTRYSRHRLRSS